MSLILCFVLFLAFQLALSKSILNPSLRPTNFEYYKTCPNKICTNNIGDYPKSAIMEVMSSTRNSDYRLDNFFGHVLNVDVSRNVHERGSSRICEPSKASIVVPLVMKNTTDSWKYIVNTDKYNQMMRIEICNSSRPTTKFQLEHIKCKQRYQKLYLLTFENFKLSYDEFEVPIMCEALFNDI